MTGLVSLNTYAFLNKDLYDFIVSHNLARGTNYITCFISHQTNFTYDIVSCVMKSLIFAYRHGVIKDTCSENKGADQLCSYCTADLHLCFCIGKNPVFS